MNPNSFQSWLSPTQRAQRTQALAPIAPAKHRPFSSPKSEQLPGSGLDLKTARIYLFTGSNTPYQSHE